MTEPDASGPGNGLPVGHRFPDRSFTIEPMRVAEYVTALGIEPEAPPWSPKVGSSVPPGFLMYVTNYGADAIHEGFGIDFRRAMYGGMDIEFFHPIRIGDTLRVSPTISKISEKESRNGPLTFVELTCDYRLPDGTLAARERSTTIQRGTS